MNFSRTSNKINFHILLLLSGIIFASCHGGSGGSNNSTPMQQSNTQNSIVGNQFFNGLSSITITSKDTPTTSALTTRASKLTNTELYLSIDPKYHPVLELTSIHSNNDGTQSLNTSYLTQDYIKNEKLSFCSANVCLNLGAEKLYDYDGMLSESYKISNSNEANLQINTSLHEIYRSIDNLIFLQIDGNNINTCEINSSNVVNASRSISSNMQIKDNEIAKIYFSKDFRIESIYEFDRKNLRLNNFPVNFENLTDLTNSNYLSCQKVWSQLPELSGIQRQAINSKRSCQIFKSFDSNIKCPQVVLNSRPSPIADAYKLEYANLLNNVFEELKQSNEAFVSALKTKMNYDATIGKLETKQEEAKASAKEAALNPSLENSQKVLAQMLEAKNIHDEANALRNEVLSDSAKAEQEILESKQTATIAQEYVLKSESTMQNPILEMPPAPAEIIAANANASEQAQVIESPQQIQLETSNSKVTNSLSDSQPVNEPQGIPISNETQVSAIPPQSEIQPTLQENSPAENNEYPISTNVETPAPANLPTTNNETNLDEVVQPIVQVVPLDNQAQSSNEAIITAENAVAISQAETADPLDAEKKQAAAYKTYLEVTLVNLISAKNTASQFANDADIEKTLATAAYTKANTQFSSIYPLKMVRTYAAERQFQARIGSYLSEVQTATTSANSAAAAASQSANSAQQAFANAKQAQTEVENMLKAAQSKISQYHWLYEFIPNSYQSIQDTVLEIEQSSSAAKISYEATNALAIKTAQVLIDLQKINKEATTPLNDLANVYAFGGSTISIASDGSVAAWGANTNAQLGLFNEGTKTIANLTVNSTPIPWTTTNSTNTKLSLIGTGSQSSYYRFSCGLGMDFNIYCWGSNFYGQVGNKLGLAMGTTYQSVTMVNSTNSFIDLDIGNHHACAISTDYKIYCWGSNSNGQLGLPMDVSKNIFTGIPLDSKERFTQISLGINFSCALNDENKAYCWGDNSVGQLGLENLTNSISTPALVQGNLKFIKISAGSDFVCGITINNEAYCWGSNNLGKLGNGTTINSSMPTPVSGGLNFADITAGGSHTCALTPTGKAYCWGQNANGRLGTNLTSSKLSSSPNPKEVMNSKGNANAYSFKSLSLSDHTCGITFDNIVRCWGLNSNGRLGLGGLEDSNNHPFPEPE